MTKDFGRPIRQTALSPSQEKNDKKCPFFSFAVAAVLTTRVRRFSYLNRKMYQVRKRSPSMGKLEQLIFDLPVAIWRKNLIHSDVVTSSPCGGLSNRRPSSKMTKFSGGKFAEGTKKPHSKAGVRDKNRSCQSG